MVIKSFFYVAYEAHNSSLKKNTPYLESNICCVYLYRAFARTTAMQSCAVMQHAGERMSTMMCQRMSSLDNTILLKYRIDIT